MADQPSLQEEGEHAPLDVVGGESAPLSMGGDKGKEVAFLARERRTEASAKEEQRASA